MGEKEKVTSPLKRTSKHPLMKIVKSIGARKVACLWRESVGGGVLGGVKGGLGEVVRTTSAGACNWGAQIRVNKKGLKGKPRKGRKPRVLVGKLIYTSRELNKEKLRGGGGGIQKRCQCARLGKGKGTFLIIKSRKKEAPSSAIWKEGRMHRDWRCVQVVESWEREQENAARVEEKGSESDP